uniref:Uncharacterized protein n=1 Tax=Anopheles atroparvus TaxID=41427 RepID=A0A182JCH1_ANOAO
MLVRHGAVMLHGGGGHEMLMMVVMGWLLQEAGRDHRRVTGRDGRGRVRVDGVLRRRQFRVVHRQDLHGRIDLRGQMMMVVVAEFLRRRGCVESPEVGRVSYRADTNSTRSGPPPRTTTSRIVFVAESCSYSTRSPWPNSWRSVVAARLRTTSARRMSPFFGAAGFLDGGSAELPLRLELPPGGTNTSYAPPPSAASSLVLLLSSSSSSSSSSELSSDSSSEPSSRFATMAVTYREVPGTVPAGRPPSGVELLLRFDDDDGLLARRILFSAPCCNVPCASSTVLPSCALPADTN